MDEVDVYDFDNEVVSPAERQPKVRQCNKYQEFLNENLPFMRVRWSYLPVGLLRLKCKEKWLKITGRTAGGHKQQPAQPKRPRRRVSFNESAEVRRIGASQSQSHPQRSRRPSHFSPLKSEPAVSSANRCRKTSIEVIPDPDDWAHSESPISRRMQQLEIGRRGSDAAGGDQPAVSDHTIHFPDTPVFENTTPPTSPQLTFSRSRSSASRSADSSVLFSCKQRTYTGFSSRRDEQPVPADENSRTADAPVTRKRKMAQSGLLRLSGRCQKKSFASASEAVPLHRRRPVLRLLTSGLIRLINRRPASKETPKTHKHKTPLLVPVKRAGKKQ